MTPNDVTPLGVLSLAISTVIAPTVGWMVRTGSRMAKQLDTIEARFDERMKDLDHLQHEAKGTDVRLIKVEDAIVDMRSASQRADEQYARIMQELKTLTRVDTLIDQILLAVGQIVPRAEIESRLRANEDKIERVDRDVREVRR